MANANEVWDENPSDSGRQGSTFATRTSNLKQAAKAKVVRNDWDDEDEEEEEQERDASEKQRHEEEASGTFSEKREAERDGSVIWEEANKRAPMPEFVAASASTGQGLPPPPPAAFQPALRILKRPTANNSSSTPTSTSPGPGSGGTSPAPRGTLAEREAQYQEARSRIFGGSSSGIVRDPLGPMSETELEQGLMGGPARGFGERRKGCQWKDMTST